MLIILIIFAINYNLFSILIFTQYLHIFIILLILIIFAIYRNLKKYFNDVSNIDLSEKVLEDIKVRTCFVTTLERSRELESKDVSVAPPNITYPGIKKIVIHGKIREKAFEVLWERDNDNLSLSTMILDAIIKVNKLYHKIFFIILL